MTRHPLLIPGSPQRRRLAKAARTLGLIRLADEVAAALAARQALSANEAWLDQNPDVDMPPVRLVYEVTGQAAYAHYDTSGREHAAVLAALFKRHKPDATRVLDWGCGPGRILAWLPRMLDLPASAFVGVDQNARAIAWARSAFADIGFQNVAHMPPTGLPSGAFDALYGLSILTHLSETAARAWLGELRRLARPGAALILTVNRQGGTSLTDEEQALLARGAVVVRNGAAPGSRAFAAYHGPETMARLIGQDFVVAERLTDGPADRLGQEIWVLRAV